MGFLGRRVFFVFTAAMTLGSFALAEEGVIFDARGRDLEALDEADKARERPTWARPTERVRGNDLRWNLDQRSGPGRGPTMTVLPPAPQPPVPEVKQEPEQVPPPTTDPKSSNVDSKLGPKPELATQLVPSNPDGPKGTGTGPVDDKLPARELTREPGGENDLDVTDEKDREKNRRGGAYARRPDEGARPAFPGEPADGGPRDELPGLLKGLSRLPAAPSPTAPGPGLELKSAHGILPPVAEERKPSLPALAVAPGDELTSFTRRDDERPARRVELPELSPLRALETLEKLATETSDRTEREEARVAIAGLAPLLKAIGGSVDGPRPGTRGTDAALSGGTGVRSVPSPTSAVVDKSGGVPVTRTPASVPFFTVGLGKVLPDEPEEKKSVAVAGDAARAVMVAMTAVAAASGDGSRGPIARLRIRVTRAGRAWLARLSRALGHFAGSAGTLLSDEVDEVGWFAPPRAARSPGRDREDEVARDESRLRELAPALFVASATLWSVPLAVVFWRRRRRRSTPGTAAVAVAPAIPEVTLPGAIAAGTHVGDFIVGRELGRGGLAVVYLARQVSLDRNVALKISVPGPGGEARILAQFEHENIVDVYSESVDASSGLKLLVMQYVPGPSLDRLFAELGAAGGADGEAVGRALDRLAPGEPRDARTTSERARLASRGVVETIACVGAQLASALHAAHERNILHLDVKPSNVLLAPSGRPCLMDFNVSVRAGSRPFGGTPRYMSPEQRRCFEGTPDVAPLDARSDVYSLGVLLAEWLQLGPDDGDALPRRRLELLLERCLEADRDRRPATALAVAEELAEILSLIS